MLTEKRGALAILEQEYMNIGFSLVIFTEEHGALAGRIRAGIYESWVFSSYFD